MFIIFIAYTTKIIIHFSILAIILYFPSIGIISITFALPIAIFIWISNNYLIFFKITFISHKCKFSRVFFPSILIIIEEHLSLF